MEARFPNGSSVSRMWRDSGEGELIGAFQYECDAPAYDHCGRGGRERRMHDEIPLSARAPAGLWRNLMPFAFKPAVRLNLDGPGGNIFAVVGGCAAAARKCGLPREQIEEFTRAAMNTESYGAALAVVREWFDMGDDE